MFNFLDTDSDWLLNIGELDPVFARRPLEAEDLTLMFDVNLHDF